MKKIILLTALLILFLNHGEVKAAEDLIKVNCTAYYAGHITATGEAARIGHGAWKREYLHKTCCIYQRLPNDEVGALLAIVELEDICPTNGVLDVRFDNLEQCQEWMNKVYEDGCKGKVYAQLVDAEG